MPKAIKIDYLTTKVPKDLKEDIENFLNDNPKLGYTSFMAFVNDSLREKFERLKSDLRVENESIEDLIKSQEDIVNSSEFKKEMQEMRELPIRVNNLEKKVDQIIKSLKGLQKID